MVKNSIKIYARLKRENPEKYETVPYDIYHLNNGDAVAFHLHPNVSKSRSNVQKFTFEKIFPPITSQDTVFNEIAKPIIKSVLNGYNGTIFAYGQTGSGKTYAITGSYTSYYGRGIIPRSIEEIFKLVKESGERYSVSISYLEIYNEIGYDLLNPKQQFSTFEDFPKIVLLEDGKGEAHLRNLTSRKVKSEEEAMKLLYLGDSNRTTAETPMNVYSSRSHCVFTISVVWTNEMLGKTRRSKLHLVDLAGSERIKKSYITGATLNEARHINLSLHYLEQVVTALSMKKIHVPYRNSMLTYMLRDSLSGNCVTVLIATLTTKKSNIEETIATCKFAQRVGVVSNETIVNEVVDQNCQIAYLRNEIKGLQNKIYTQSKQILSKEEKDHWGNLIKNYLDDKEDDLELKNCDFRHIQYCFKMFKETVREQETEKLKLESTVDSNNHVIDECKQVISIKEKEIETLKNLIFGAFKFEPTNENKENLPPKNVKNATPSQSHLQLQALATFLKDSTITKELLFYKQGIQDMYNIAANLNYVVDECRKKIIEIKTKIVNAKTFDNVAQLQTEIENNQTIYRRSLDKLKALKQETDHFKIKCLQSKATILATFLKWYNKLDVEESVESVGERTILSNPNENDLKIQLEDNLCYDTDSSDHRELLDFLDDFPTYTKKNDNVQQLKSERPYSKDSEKRISSLSLPFPVDNNRKKFKNEGCMTSYEPDYLQQCCDLLNDKLSQDKFTDTNLDKEEDLKQSEDDLESLDLLDSRELIREIQRSIRSFRETQSKRSMKNYNSAKACKSKTLKNIYKNESKEFDIEQDNKPSDPKISLNCPISSSSTCLDPLCTTIFENISLFSNSENGYVATNQNFVNFKSSSCLPSSFDIYNCFVETSNQSTSLIKNRSRSTRKSNEMVFYSDNSDCYKSAKDTDSQTSIDYDDYNHIQITQISKFCRDSDDTSNYSKEYVFIPDDTVEFRQFIQGITLTGDTEIDKEVVKFYRAKFNFIIDG